MSHPYEHPDIRKQTIAEAEAFIAQKRVRRLIVLASYQEKAAAKLSTLKGKELASFQTRKDRVDKSMEKVIAAIESLERAVAAMNTAHNAITNIEQEEIRL